MRHIKLLIEYDGTNYQGWQSQKSGITIQDILKREIFSITDEHVRLTGASRTDAGVHALGQVAVFATCSRLPADTISRALNAKLPQDIRILNAEEIESHFHPRYDARRKSYFYIIAMKTKQSAFLYRYVWDVKTKLDIEAMIKASGYFKGEIDFSALRASGCSAKTSVRRVYSLDITHHRKIGFMTATIKGDFMKIRIEANAFLRHMARNIVGTLVEVGRGRISPETVERIIESRDRRKAGPTAPSNGLFLENITY
ncbi:MAG: tRNA pseudouridine(38-40) synthase TruA [Nitrospirota bacterium]